MCSDARDIEEGLLFNDLRRLLNRPTHVDDDDDDVEDSFFASSRRPVGAGDGLLSKLWERLIDELAGITI